jgi:hypothetical protein
MLAANSYSNLPSTVTKMDARSARPPLPSSCARGACPRAPCPANPALQAGRKRCMTVRAIPEPADAPARPMRAAQLGLGARLRPVPVGSALCQRAAACGPPPPPRQTGRRPTAAAPPQDQD